ncbi:MAG: nucleotidyltransferase domain-containing protein [Bacteroidales bacterium]|nr:nucleotidyltransferase domain-containing protein [Bacteroidales bacterium]MCD8395106.1 nucleotidyltransferase domain-containing protein [Bacteroidales bacterium]
MISTSTCIDTLRNYYQTVAQTYGVKRMGLFGSIARGDQDDTSDVDIIYEGEANLLLRCRMKRELEELMGTSVDIIRLRPALQSSFFFKNIASEIIYV